MSRRQFNIKLLFVLTTATAVVLAVIMSWPERRDYPSTWNRDHIIGATLSSTQRGAGVRIIDGDILAYHIVLIESRTQAGTQDEVHECIVWTITQDQNGEEKIQLTYLVRDPSTEGDWVSPIYEGEDTALNEAFFDEPPAEQELAHFVSWSDWSWVPVPAGKRRNIRVRSSGHGFREVLFVEGKFSRSAWKKLTGQEQDLDIPDAYR